MTTVVSRLYANKLAADEVVSVLRAQGYPQGIIDVISDGDGDAVDRIRRARVGREAAEAYASRLGDGKALVVVRVPFMPIGAAKNAIETVDRFDSVNAGVANQNEYLREEPSSKYMTSKILKNHPRFLTGDLPAPHRTFLTRNLDLSADNRIGTISSKIGLPLLKRHKDKRSVILGGAFMSRKFLPFPLLKRHKDKLSVIRGGGTPFSTLLALPLLTRRS